MATETKTFYPGAYEGASGLYGIITNPTNPVGKGSSNTTYAEVPARNGTAYVYWPFDISIIPADAIIDSVTCAAKAGLSNLSSTTGRMRLYSGTTAKGTATSISTATVYNLSCGTWTRAELTDIRLRTEITNSSTSTRYFRFYGADLTIAYTYNTEQFLIKQNGSWAGAATVYKKVNGVWVEQTDLANLMSGSVRYQNAGEYVPPTKTVTITGSGYEYNGTLICGVRINGVTYTSPATVEVNPGDTVAVVLSQGSTAQISLNGTVVQNGNGTYNHTVNENCTINMSVDFSSGALSVTITTS